MPITPINPKAGERELAHILTDSDPELLLCPPGTDVPAAAAERERVDVDLGARGGELPPELPDDAPAIVVYTSGTTGPPKGAVLPRRSIASNLDALAEAWEWTDADVVAHALPLFHVHGLILGTLGPVRRGGGVHHLGRFSADGGRRRAGRRRRRCCSPSRRCTTGSPPRPRRTRRSARGFASRAPARLRLGGAPGRRARADRAADRPEDRRALRA